MQLVIDLVRVDLVSWPGVCRFRFRSRPSASAFVPSLLIKMQAFRTDLPLLMGHTDVGIDKDNEGVELLQLYLD
jgi:hypothetical protein